MNKRKVLANPEIPHYELKDFRKIHRQEREVNNFGYNKPEPTKMIDGFELYSSVGLKGDIGPLKSAFYRISITMAGSVDICLGLEHFKSGPGAIACTFPNQVFSKGNISEDIFGYYILFNPGFLDELVPAVEKEFPFFDFSGTPFFQLLPGEIAAVESFVLKMNDELQAFKPGREKALRMYLYLLLLEVKRSYERQKLHLASTGDNDGFYLVTRFKKLVSQHFLIKKRVADYAGMLAVTANHLNRMIKESTGKTASDFIAEMLLQEARAVLKHTDASIAEISYQLDFSDPASFNRFFKKHTGQTPMAYRGHAAIG